jgi:HSP20 family molecular chaperone IbpA
MKKMNKNFLNYDLITGIDILNTLNGGTVEPTMKFAEFPEYHEIKVKAPGIAEEELHVNIENNQLVIFYELDIESQGKSFPVPRIVYNKPIPFFIDTFNINAQYSGNTLIVQLPFNELANGYHREVPIGNN